MSCVRVPLEPGFDERVESLRAVERARYAFVVSADRPFDVAYPRAVFEKRVREEQLREQVLRRVYGVTVRPEILAGEYDRIERTTASRDQWLAMKNALAGDRRRIEDIVCRPLVVEGLLRTYFDVDLKLHSRQHEEARRARAAYLQGQTPSGSRRMFVPTDPTEAAQPPLLPPGGAGAVSGIIDPTTETRVQAQPALVKALERELKSPGDVSTILEDRDRFQVFRLVDRAAGGLRVDGVTVPKRAFAEWLAEEARQAR